MFKLIILSIVNTNTCTTSMSLIKIYLKFLKNPPTCFGHSTIMREFFSSSLKSLFINNTLDIPILKTGDVAASHNSTHITRHAATSPVFNIEISKMLLIKVILARN